MTDPRRTDPRDETAAQRLDRNWNEILQELRITQTGVQILFAFLLILPFQARFGILTPQQDRLYIVVIGAVTASMLCVISPALLHRVVFQRRAKDVLVRASSWLTLVGLVFLGLALIGGVGLVVDVVLGGVAGWIAAAAAATALVLLWVVLPWQLLRRSTGIYE